MTPYKYPANWESIAHQVRVRDGYRCVNCGRSDLPLHVDHIWPLSQGGTNDWSNLRTLCEDCHTRRHPSMWRNSYWRGRLDQRMNQQQWNMYFANIKENVLGELHARTAVQFSESQLTPRLRQSISEIEGLHHQYNWRGYYVQNLVREKRLGITTVIVFACLGGILLLAGLVGVAIASEPFRVASYSIAIIGAGLLAVTSLMYLEMVRKKDKLARQAQREVLELQSLIQTRLVTTSNEIQTELSRK